MQHLMLFIYRDLIARNDAGIGGMLPVADECGRSDHQIITSGLRSLVTPQITIIRLTVG